MNDNTKKKAQFVQEMLEKHYEPERLDRCKLWVYRNHIRNTIPMSERTFWRYVTMDVTSTGSATDGEDERQLKLFE